MRTDEGTGPAEDLPAHPGQHDPAPPLDAGQRRKIAAIVLLAVAVLAAIIVLHATGVLGEGAHG